ncbi:MAG: sensor histidine kinase [Rubrivivax sp.]|nr:sensor histidine kinase [Rubrivivax sp.]
MRLSSFLPGGLRLGIATWIAGVSLMALLPLVGFSAYVVWRQMGEQQVQAALAMQHRAQITAVAVSHELSSLFAGLATLAEAEQKRPDDAAGLQSLAQLLARADRRFARLSLVSEQAETVLDSHLEAGVPWPPVFLVQFQRPLGEEGDPRSLSPVIAGAVAGRALLQAPPPLAAGSGRPLWLRAVVRAEAVAARLNEQPWPPDWTAELLDQDDIVVASSGGGAGVVGLPASAGVVAGLRSGAAEFVARSGAGVALTATAAPVPGTAWRVVVGRPQAALEAHASQSITAIAVAGLLCATLAVGGALGLARSLSRQLHAVVQAHARRGGTARPDTAITEVATLSEALGRAEASAERAAGELSHAREEVLAQLRERSEMLDVLAHEVRQPLNNAGSALQAAAAVFERGADGAASAPLRRAATVLGEVQASIDNTLAAAALLVGQTVAREDADIDALLAVSLGDLPPGDAARVRIERDTATRTASMDASLMRLALRNLLSNALKFSAPPAMVTVRIADSDEPLALLIDVVDAGPGIDAERLAHLFQRSDRRPLGASGRRQGLGLYIVRRVMEVQGGSVELLRNGPSGVTMRLVVDQAADD